MNVIALPCSLEQEKSEQMLTLHSPTNRGLEHESDLPRRLKQSAIELYELPIEFWKQVLDDEMHFHLGHFRYRNTTFADAMRFAVQRLASELPLAHFSRVLDIGCGWGGPAFELNRMWQSEVHGVTISKCQTAYVNSRAKESGTQVWAETRDADECDFTGIGKFDVIWLYDSLDHIVNREDLFAALHSAAKPNSHMALATHCRSQQVTQELYGDFMGIQPIQNVEHIATMLENHGWRVLNVNDYTHLTFPVWSYWRRNLDRLREYSEAKRLSAALAETEASYRSGMLECIQLVAKRI